jgi:acyl-CoA synthetase (NDP forming)
MFGLGGIFVEILHDVSFRLIPLTTYDAREMITEIKAFPVLKGVRGQSPKDIDSIVDAMLKVSHMVEEHPQIRELDLNPIIVYEKGLSVIDARIVL